MFVTLLLQLLVLCLVAAVFYWLRGYDWGLSAFLGGFSYVLPTAVSVLVLSVFGSFRYLAGVGFFLAEGLKIILALAFMVLLFYFYHRHLVFIPFVSGLFAASHLVFLVSWKVQKNGK